MPGATGSTLEERLAEALRVAKRYNLPQSQIDDWLEKKPEEFLAWAGERGDNQAKTDKHYEELSSLRNQVAELKAQVGQPPTPKVSTVGDQASGDQAGQSAAQADQQRALAVSESLGLGESDARKLLEALRPVSSGESDQVIAALQQQVASTQEQFMSVAESLRQQKVSTVRGQLQKEFPGLSEQERFQKVESRVGKMIEAGDYTPEQVDLAMRDACRVEFFEDMKAAVLAQGKAQTQAAQPSAPGGPVPVGSSEKNSGELAMHYLMQGLSPEEVAAKVSQHMKQ